MAQLENIKPNFYKLFEEFEGIFLRIYGFLNMNHETQFQKD